MTRLTSFHTDSPPPVRTPKPGDVLGEKYRIEREIGSGGMGIVYEVTHLLMTKKRYAIKWLLPLPEGYQSEDAQIASRRFVREAEIAGGIRHPNVVEVYDVTVGENDCFMVMELLEGESLEARLKRAGPVPVLEAVRIMLACAAGVGAAHAANVIHRDLKPANIFLVHVPGTEQAWPKVLDFGISRFTAPEGSTQSTVTRAGTLIGTPMYMAPEQLRGFECDARTDVYGLGVTLYEALAGGPAYQAQTHADLVVRILTGAAEALHVREPRVPARLSAIVMQALHHEPEKRFPTVQAFAEALQAFMNAPDQPAPANHLGPQRKSRKIHWALGLALVTAGVLTAGWLSSDAEQTLVRPAGPQEAQPEPPTEPLPSGALPEPPPQPPAAAARKTPNDDSASGVASRKGVTTPGSRTEGAAATSAEREAPPPASTSGGAATRPTAKSSPPPASTSGGAATRPSAKSSPPPAASTRSAGRKSAESRATAPERAAPSEPAPAADPALEPAQPQRSPKPRPSLKSL